MRKIVSFCFLVILATNVYADKNKGLIKQIGNGLSFTENKGQIHDQNYKSRADVLYSGTSGQLSFHLKNNGISYQQYRIDSWKNDIDSKTKEQKEIPDQITIYRLDLNWLNCNTNSRKLSEFPREDFANYYTASCPNGALNVKSYKQITYQLLYKGIDLKWYEKEGHLKYDYIVKAGADYKQIQIEINGAKEISINKEGELVIVTPLGTITEQAPLVIQNNKTLKSKWLIKNKIISFDIEKVNPEEDFIIDPIIRDWGTYFGGAGNTVGRGLSTDKNANAYVVGSTQSLSNIATAGAYQTIYGGANTDAFLVKFNSLGVIKWATYYGGTGGEDTYSCPIDTNGNVYMAGVTTSTVGIATPGSFQTTPGGGFLAKFDSLGVRQWATYYIIGLVSCALDANDNIYTVGSANSSTAILSTAGSHQTVYGGGSGDAVLIKFNNNGFRQWATYYGGSGNENGFHCAIDINNNVYMCGFTTTSSSTIIATSGAHQMNLGGMDDAFLVKFNSLGIRQWGTYYGGIFSDCSSGRPSCALDSIGNVFLFSSTQSPNGISTIGSHQPNLAAQTGHSDSYLVKFNSSGIRQWGTYFGAIYSNADLAGYSCATDHAGNIYITGRSQTGPTYDGIPTPGCYQFLTGGGDEAYLVKLNSAGIRQWATYYGGAGDEGGLRCAVIKGTNNIYLTGLTSTTITGTSIASPGSSQISNGGQTNAFLVKFSDCPPPIPPTNITAAINQNICANDSTTLTVSGSGTINWFLSSTGGTAVAAGSSFVTTTLSVGSYTFYAQDSTCAVSISRTPIVVSVTNSVPSLSIVGTSSVCSGASTSLMATGAATYSWSTGAITNTVTVIPSSNTTYSVDGANGCGTSTETISITVDNTCAEVWPGDANSDGTADNLDVLELGLHYTQTGAQRASTSNVWQSYFANNWTGTITNGKNLNHSDCNGDGIINDDDTLAIYNNYGLIHTFKPAQTTTVNPQLSIVPDQSMVTKGTWGTASVYLGDATSQINNINGIAFTVDFDNTLIEPNSIWLEYQNSFLDANQNLYFRKLDFANSKLYTASTHTVSNNVSGFGKIATLHYQIKSSLTTDEVLNIGISQANQSNTSGVISPLTSGTGTLMAIGASVGIKENSFGANVLVSPNPTNGLLNISFNTLPQNTKIELYNSIGALVLTETMINKNNTINASELSSGIYFMKVVENNKVVAVKKVVRE